MALAAEYTELTTDHDHSVIGHFQLKHIVRLKRRAMFAAAIWQESHLCQYKFLIINLLIQSKTDILFLKLPLVNRNQFTTD